MELPPFKYGKAIPIAPDETEYDHVSKEHVKIEEAFGRTFLRVAPEALSFLTEEAFKKIGFYLRESHLKQILAIINDPEVSTNDRFVALSLLKNSIISAETRLPMCQDTGTATVIGWKGEGVLTGADDLEWISKGVFHAYTKNPFRYSQMVPISMLTEKNSGTNLPAQIDITATTGCEYNFLFIAKGGGSANKTKFYAKTPAILNGNGLEKFLESEIPTLGVAACPPYHLVVVIGGSSPEANLKVGKLASTGFLDTLPNCGSDYGSAFRDTEWEKKVMVIAEKCGLGSQFGGTYYALDAKVIRLPRHAASVPISISVSCNAHRNVKAKITAEGLFLEKLEENPSKYLEEITLTDELPREEIDLNRPVLENIEKLSKFKVGTLLSLSGPLIVARDLAHARIYNELKTTGKLPDYLKNHFVYYAGPAKTPDGLPSGSFGPTTAERMDGYIDEFMANGGSLVTLAKGNRSDSVTESCKKYGGFYLGTIGGAAAIVAKENITSSEVVDFPELGMEAVRKIEVKNLPAFILINKLGDNLYKL